MLLNPIALCSIIVIYYRVIDNTCISNFASLAKVYCTELCYATTCICKMTEQVYQVTFSGQDRWIFTALVPLERQVGLLFAEVNVTIKYNTIPHNSCTRFLRKTASPHQRIWSEKQQQHKCFWNYSKCSKTII